MFLAGLGLVIGVARSSFAPPLLQDDPIVTDRPDLTESAVVVPVGRLQIESGFTVGSEDGDRFGQTELLLRGGFAKNLEWRLGAPAYITVPGASGFGDMYLGLKLQLGPFGETDMAIIPGATLDTGEDRFSSGGCAPEIKFCVARPLNDKWSVSSMLHAGSVPSNGGRRTEWLGTVSFAHSIRERLSGFLEYAGQFAEGSLPAHLAHAGLVLQLDDDRQVDVHFGTSIGGTSDVKFIAAGYSIRL